MFNRTLRLSEINRSAVAARAECLKMQLLILAWKESARQPSGTALLTLLSISFSVLLLVGVEPSAHRGREFCQYHLGH